MTSDLVSPVVGAPPRRGHSWSRALAVSLALHVGWVAWAAQYAATWLNRWSIEAGANSTAAIEARFSEGDINAERIHQRSEEIALQISKSAERTSPEDRLATGGRPVLVVAKHPTKTPQPQVVSPQGELPSLSLPPVELQEREPVSNPVVAAHDTTAAVPRAHRAPEVQVEPVEPSVASAASAASQESRGASAMPPAALVNPAPLYPPAALARGLTGRVSVRVRLADDGRVAQASVYRSSGETLLDDAALAAVRNWRFEPPRATALREFSVPVRFVIGGR